ncbi:hypothetical protein SAMN05444271_12039 [Halohasta litchfieldiae]|jgi:hypothetical protein|uniref:Uncharacterized protein n=1 Tax=Halohasta litchfieldiae TaxID=1073996 RepID=A0A1H6VW19_9EURY|nr:hypothetical protein SAMN05444271_12039 [Halohasta litchfieldiae]
MGISAALAWVRAMVVLAVGQTAAWWGVVYGIL